MRGTFNRPDSGRALSFQEFSEQRTNHGEYYTAGKKYQARPNFLIRHDVAAIRPGGQDAKISIPINRSGSLRERLRSGESYGDGTQVSTISRGTRVL
jgi:hypothetical protein